MVASTSPARLPAWTILMYQAGDNNLRSCLVQNLVDCQHVGSSDDINIVSQLDRGNKVGCNRYFVQKSDSVNISSPILQSMGQVDMADPKTLSDFVEWGMKTYPAEHTMLIISDHGDAWKGAIADDSAKSFMSLPNIQQALQSAQNATGRKLDVLGFDACLMANAEVAEQLKGTASYLVASEETEGQNGWPYNRLLSEPVLRSLQKATQTRSDTGPEAFARRVVSSGRDDQGMLPTMAAIDLSKIPSVTTAVKGLATALATTPKATLAPIVDQTQKFDDTSDLGDFADRLLKGVDDPQVQAAASAVKASIGQAVLAEEHSDSYAGAHGLSINLTPGAPPDDYRSLAFPAATGWDGILAAA